MSFGPNMWFRHRYKLVEDMHGRVRYECEGCSGPHSVGPWRSSKDPDFKWDWAEQDGADHVVTGAYA